MVGIVGGIAALILTFGLASILDFQTFWIDTDQSDITLKERLVINNVTFYTNGTVQIYVRNVGLNIVTIESFSITNIDTQINIILANDPSTDLLTLTPKALGWKAFASGAPCTTFPAASACATANYDVRIVTERANIFYNEVRPFRL